ncbi:MAG: hypothetical protein JO126_04830 [Alphaproteobacteria bacterium]|nr:hypothetical protein [Alphaproteobacteria bacterium]MBV8548761.1 hypothetical protein [Alphaproteobacteria bacterium]
MTPDLNHRPYGKILNPTWLIVTLGFFIDCFDLFLFNALRAPSLRDLVPMKFCGRVTP